MVRLSGGLLRIARTHDSRTGRRPGGRFAVYAGILTTAQQFGNAAGATVLGTVFFSLVGSTPSLHNYITAMTVSAFGCAGIAVVILSTSFLLPKR